MIFIIFIFSANSCLFLNIPNGILSQGLGGVESVVYENYACINNPSLICGRSFNFALGRYLYGLNHLSFGAAYQKYGGAISYLDYGEIQSYDEFGQPMKRFSPYDLIIAGGMSLGNFGWSMKAFQERIDSLELMGVCFGLGANIYWGKALIGSKIDNIGKEFRYDAGLPFVIANGLRYELIDSLEIFFEIKSPHLSFHSGLLYLYQNSKIFVGMRYMRYEDTNSNDMSLSGGLTIRLEEYEFGYSFMYTQYSTAHLFSINFTP